MSEIVKLLAEIDSAPNGCLDDVRRQLRVVVVAVMEMREAVYGDRRVVNQLATERDVAREHQLAAERELERWRHNTMIEGDYVCPDTLECERLKADVARLTAERDLLFDLAHAGSQQLGDMNRDGLAAQAEYDRAGAQGRRSRIQAEVYRAAAAHRRRHRRRDRGEWGGIVTTDGLWTRFVRCWRSAAEAAIGWRWDPSAVQGRTTPGCHNWCGCGQKGCPNA